MAKHGIESALEDLADPGTEWITLARVDTIAEHSKFGYVLECTEVPSGRKIIARPRYTSTRTSGGEFAPYEIGDEVLVFYPYGDPNCAIAFGGLTSEKKPLPSDFDNSKIVITHPSGIEIRIAEGSAVEKLLKSETFNTDLAAYIGAVNTYFSTTVSAPGTVVQNAASLTTIIAAMATFSGTIGPADFKGKLGTETYKSQAAKAE